MFQSRPEVSSCSGEVPLRTTDNGRRLAGTICRWREVCRPVFLTKISQRPSDDVANQAQGTRPAKHVRKEYGQERAFCQRIILERAFQTLATNGIASVEQLRRY